jgi:hypothetical protein
MYVEKEKPNQSYYNLLTSNTLNKHILFFLIFQLRKDVRAKAAKFLVFLVRYFTSEGVELNKQQLQQLLGEGYVFNVFSVFSVCV